jgi:hypothetical protein
VSEQEEPDLSNLTSEQVRYVQKLRETASARMVRVTTNNKFPRWNLERWLTVLIFVWGLLGGGTGAIWFFATEWSNVKTQLSELTEEMPVVRGRLEALNAHLSSLQGQIDRQDEIIPRPNIRPAQAARPTFSETERFTAGENR